MNVAGYTALLRITTTRKKCKRSPGFSGFLIVLLKIEYRQSEFLNTQLKNQQKPDRKLGKQSNNLGSKKKRKTFGG